MLEKSTTRSASSKRGTDGTGILSAAPRERVAAERKMCFRTAQEIATRTPAVVPWISRPWVAEGSITEVVGKPKTAGKTTWIFHMIRSVLNGAEFMEEPTTKTQVVYLSEERNATLREALQRAELLNRKDLFVLQWRDTLGVLWEQVVQAAVQECARQNAKLLVVDTVSQFAHLPGDTENQSGAAVRCVFSPTRSRSAGASCHRHPPRAEERRRCQRCRSWQFGLCGRSGLRAVGATT